MRYIVSIIIAVLGALFIFFKAYVRFSVRDNDAGLMYVLSALCFVFLAINSYLQYRKNKK